MRQSGRQTAILKQLESDGELAVTALAERLAVSPETIRRDLKMLADQGAVVKTHGAVLLAARTGEAPFERRMRQNAEEKQRIAAAAAALVADGDSVMMDTGTTTSFVARALLSRRDLTIVTNSSDVARTLALVNGNKVFMAGGQLRGDNGAAFGSAAIDFIRRFRVRLSMISIGAVDPAAGPMNYDLAEAEFGAEMLRQGETRVIVTDHSKFGRTALVKVCDFADIDLLVTDRSPPGPIADQLATAGTRVVLAA